VGTLDQMTQQNAALVGQSAAAADSLKSQAARLVDAMAIFRLEGTAEPLNGQAPKAAGTALTSAAKAY
jgi:methyl-accepting chemotaxis protein